MPDLTREELDELEQYYIARPGQEVSSFTLIRMAREAIELRAEVGRLQNSPAMKWEADHQRAVLEPLGLADEFPWGCDAIEHVGEALIGARQELKRMAREAIELKAAGLKITPMENSYDNEFERGYVRGYNSVLGRIHEIIKGEPNAGR